MSGRGRPQKQSGAAVWLKAYVSDGIRSVAEIELFGAKLGYSLRTLKRTKASIGVKSRLTSGANGREWGWFDPVTERVVSTPIIPMSPVPSLLLGMTDTEIVNEFRFQFEAGIPLDTAVPYVWSVVAARNCNPPWTVEDVKQFGTEEYEDAKQFGTEDPSEPEQDVTTSPEPSSEPVPPEPRDTVLMRRVESVLSGADSDDISMTINLVNRHIRELVENSKTPKMVAVPEDRVIFGGYIVAKGDLANGGVLVEREFILPVKVEVSSTCQGTTKDGSRCVADIRVVDGETRFCKRHVHQAGSIPDHPAGELIAVGRTLFEQDLIRFFGVDDRGQARGLTRKGTLVRDGYQFADISEETTKWGVQIERLNLRIRELETRPIRL